MALRLAVLERAILDMGANLDLNGRLANPHEKWDASRWIYSNSMKDFSFLDICESLDLEVEAIREIVRRTWSKRDTRNKRIGMNHLLAVVRCHPAYDCVGENFVPLGKLRA